MAGGFLKALDIEQHEAKGVSLLFAQSVFIGIFYGALEIGSSALFLEQFPASKLTVAYAVSGLAGILITTVFSRLQNKISYRHLTILSILFIFLITAIMRAGFGFIDIKTLVFIMMVFMGPLRIVALIGFWGTVGRMFTLLQGKRLFSLIDGGWIFGIILSSYLIPVLLKYKFLTKDLLFISASSIVIALGFQFIINRVFKLKLTSAKSEVKEENSKEKSLLFLMKNPFILVMSIFVGLSMMSAFFIQYSFLSVTKEQYPNSTEFAIFLGYYIGTMMIVILLIKTFVFSKLIKTYGLKLAMIISPIVLILFAVLAAIAGSIFGSSADSEKFTFFFLLIALTKLFSAALKDAIEAPSFKILYQSLDSAIRFNVQARVDGTINEFSALFSGIFLALLAMIPFFKTIYFIYVLAGVLIIWVFIAFRLYNQYKFSLQKSLLKVVSTKKNKEVSFEDTSEILKSEIKNAPAERKIYLLKLYEMIDPIKYEDNLDSYLDNKDTLLRKFALNEINRLQLIRFRHKISELINIETDREVKELASITLMKFNLEFPETIAIQDVEKLAGSALPDDRKKACKLLGRIHDYESVHLINKLLRDYDRNVKIEAIKIACTLYNKDTISLLVDLIENPQLANYISSTLEIIGSPAIENLEHAFYKSEVDNLTQLRLVKILGKIKDRQNIGNLLNKIDYINKDVQLQSALSLRQHKFKPDENTSYQIHEAIKNLIGCIAWNISAQASLEESNSGNYLVDAIKEELKNNFNKLYLLLSLAYDPRSIDHVKENLETGTSEGIGFAIELLDQFIADELKRILYPVLDDSSKTEKIRQLQNFYPVEKIIFKNLLIAIINRDPNLINCWTKACALMELDRIQSDEINPGIIAQLFNPEPILREISALLIDKKNHSLYLSLSERLPLKTKKELDDSMQKLSQKLYISYYERIILLKEHSSTRNLSGFKIYLLVKNSDFISINPKSILKNIKDKHSIIFMLKGNGRFFKDDYTLNQFTEKEMVNFIEMYPEGLTDSNYLEFDDSSMFISINNNKLSNLLFEDSTICMNLIMNK